MTRLLFYFAIFCLSELGKFAQNCKIFAKEGSQFCQILYSYSRNGQKLNNYLPNLWIFAKAKWANLRPPIPVRKIAAQKFHPTNWRFIISTYQNALKPHKCKFMQKKVLEAFRSIIITLRWIKAVDMTAYGRWRLVSAQVVSCCVY